MFTLLLLTVASGVSKDLPACNGALARGKTQANAICCDHCDFSSCFLQGIELHVQKCKCAWCIFVLPLNLLKEICVSFSSTLF